jgi:FkbM family methyltransferase
MGEMLPGRSGENEAAFVRYIKTFRVGRREMKFYFATPEARDWYDPVKPHTQLEYEWVEAHLDLSGQVVADVGTHHGHYAVLLGKMKPRRLVCVDAVESNLDIARLNLALNEVAADVRHAAITTRDGPVQFTGETNGRVVERGVVEVSGLRLPTLAPDATVVKLDIEGEEFRVLPDQLDEMPGVHTWIIEIHPWKTRDPHTLMPLLIARFDVLWINRAALRVEKYPSHADWSAHTTVICRR